jgi:hypothetical protein
MRAVKSASSLFSSFCTYLFESYQLDANDWADGDEKPSGLNMCPRDILTIQERKACATRPSSNSAWIRTAFRGVADEWHRALLSQYDGRETLDRLHWSLRIIDAPFDLRDNAPWLRTAARIPVLYEQSVPHLDPDEDPEQGIRSWVVIADMEAMNTGKLLIAFLNQYGATEFERRMSYGTGTLEEALRSAWNFGTTRFDLETILETLDQAEGNGVPAVLNSG